MLHSIFQLGLLTFAVVLGVVCSDISAAVESIQSGNYAVVESGQSRDTKLEQADHPCAEAGMVCN